MKKTAKKTTKTFPQSSLSKFKVYLSSNDFVVVEADYFEYRDSVLRLYTERDALPKEKDNKVACFKTWEYVIPFIEDSAQEEDEEQSVYDQPCKSIGKSRR